MVNNNNNINQYVDKKPFEIVQEVNNEIPSFEEFMKSYEEGVNYDDLNSWDVGSRGSSVKVGVDGFETKVAGFGFSVGKKTGISFGVGEIAVDTDDCVIQ